MTHSFQLADWLIEPELNQLSRAGQTRRLEPKVMAVLVCLSAQPGAVVGKEELLRQVWGARFVSDEVLTTAVWELRRALGDDAKAPRYIQTVPRKGYRLIASVRPPEAAPVEPPVRVRRWRAAALTVAALSLFACASAWMHWRQQQAEARAAYQQVKRTEASVRQSLALFERAARLAPAYAPAYAGQADAWLQLAMLNALPPSEAFPPAKAAALRAVQLDARSAEAHTSLAMIRFCHEWDWIEAERGFKHALALDPAYTTARNWYGQYLWAAGRLEEAAHEIQLAQAGAPRSTGIQMTAANLYALRGQPDAAIAAYQRALALDADYAAAWKALGKLYEKQARTAEARQAWQRFYALSGTPPASALPALKDKDDAQYVLHKLGLLWKLKYIRPTYVARLYLDVGDKERAFAWLDRALSERDSDLLLLRSDHSWDALRGDPRFAVLAGRVGLPL